MLARRVALLRLGSLEMSHGWLCRIVENPRDPPPTPPDANPPPPPPIKRPLLPGGPEDVADKEFDVWICCSGVAEDDWKFVEMETLMVCWSGDSRRMVEFSGSFLLRIIFQYEAWGVLGKALRMLSGLCRSKLPFFHQNWQCCVISCPDLITFNFPYNSEPKLVSHWVVLTSAWSVVFYIYFFLD